MANALNTARVETEREKVVLHQLLHGYKDGHRLLEGSIEIPHDLRRLVLRLSDLSGSNLSRGFEDYITGYPLISLNAYALAKTWYAQEMPRPGCVWTHTIVIPAFAMAQIKSLHSLRVLFRRPGERGVGDSYAKPLNFKDEVGSPFSESLQPQQLLQTLLSLHYAPSYSTVVLSAQTSKEFEDLVFSVWSQKWPSLRMAFTFCTGSLSARAIDKRFLDIQCVPASRHREVLLEMTLSGAANPVVANSQPFETSSWSTAAANDALMPEGGGFREFLWTVSDASRDSADFAKFSLVYNALNESKNIDDLISLVAKHFPQPTAGRHLKRLLFGEEDNLFSLPRPDIKELILAMSTTSDFRAFNSEDLALITQGKALCLNAPDHGSDLVGDLFRSPLNPLGEEVLAGLVSSIEPETARRITGNQLQFLPALFRAKPSLATSSQLWALAGDRSRELFEALAIHNKLDPQVVKGVINGLLESGGQRLLRRAFDLWGKPAVDETLNWIASHNGAISEHCCEALQLHMDLVIDWMESHPMHSPDMFMAFVGLAAPNSSAISRRDATVWLKTHKELDFTGKRTERLNSCAFLLSLGLRNTPPDPLGLVAESFNNIHEAARAEFLPDSAWVVLEPLVPELSWLSNWDKCERLRRGLISAFVRYGWPSNEIKSVVNDHDLLKQIVRSASKVEGGDLLISRGRF